MNSIIGTIVDEQNTFNNISKKTDYQTTKHLIPDIEKRKSDAKDDILYNHLLGNYRTINGRTSPENNSAKQEAVQLVDSKGIHDGYNRLWSNFIIDAGKQIKKPINRYGHITNAPKCQMIVETDVPLETHTKKRAILVSSFDERNPSAPIAAITTGDFNQVLEENGEDLLPNTNYYWSELKDITERYFNEIKVTCALTEFEKKTGIYLDEFKSRLVHEPMYKIDGTKIYPIKLVLTNDEYDNLTCSISKKISRMTQPEISDVYYQKYLKYKNKYLQLKKQLK